MKYTQSAHASNLLSQHCVYKCFQLLLRTWFEGTICVSLFVPLRNRWTPPSPSSIGGDRCWYLIQVFPVSNAIFVPKYSFEYRRIYSTNLYENGVKRNCIDLAKRFRTISVKKKSFSVLLRPYASIPFNYNVSLILLE